MVVTSCGLISYFANKYKLWRAETYVKNKMPQHFTRYSFLIADMNPKVMASIRDGVHTDKEKACEYFDLYFTTHNRALPWMIQDVKNKIWQLSADSLV